jgi:hypothetical protein
VENATQLRGVQLAHVAALSQLFAFANELFGLGIQLAQFAAIVEPLDQFRNHR